MADNAKAKSRSVLKPTALRQNGADYVRTYHHVVVPVETTIDDILRPGFWAHHVGTLNTGDLIDILSEDDGIDMQVRVTGKGIGMVHMRPLRIWSRDIGADDVDDEDVGDAPEGYAVTFAPKQKWRVATKEPAAIIFKDLPSKKAAIAKANEHAAQANAA